MDAMSCTSEVFGQVMQQKELYIAKGVLKHVSMS